MLIEIIATTVAFALSVEDPGSETACRFVSASGLRQQIDEILRETSAVNRIELASNLSAIWRVDCLSSEESKKEVATQLGRLLTYRELRPYAAEELYDLGNDVRSIKQEIHRAYIDQRNDVSRRSKIVPVITGSDVAVEHALKCLDVLARFGRTSKKHCKYISGR